MSIAKGPVNPQQPITTRDELIAHLYEAAQVEMSTIPLYLYAAYSVETQGYWQWSAGMSAVKAIRSVVIEEMLHLSLVRNLLIAVGDTMQVCDPAFLPRYPTSMLHRVPPLELQLEPCTTALMRDVFMPLERPEKSDAPPQPDRYNTLGQFYDAVQLGFETLAGPDLWSANRPDLQYTAAYWNTDGGGKPMLVCDLPSALQAIRTIVEQGEGSDPNRDTVPIDPAAPVLGVTELSHYAKFQRIAEGIDLICSVYPVPTNPKAVDFEGSVRELVELFNASYTFVLHMLDVIYATSRSMVRPGQMSERYGLERSFMAAMNGLLYPIATELVRTPVGTGTHAGLHAAPTFEFYQFSDDRLMREQLATMCDGLLGYFPSLGGDNSVRRVISRLPNV